jgi:hypothetical protein
MGWTFRIAGPSIAAIALVGCDMLGGVQRQAMLDHAPDAACVKAAIEQTPGIAEVTAHHAESTGYSFAGAHVSIYDSFFFTGGPGSNVMGVVSMNNRDPKQGKDDFTTSLVDINHTPPQAKIDASRPVMKAIEERVAASCAVPVLATLVKETCFLDAKCPPLN